MSCDFLRLPARCATTASRSSCLRAGTRLRLHTPQGWTKIGPATHAVAEMRQRQGLTNLIARSHFVVSVQPMNDSILSTKHNDTMEITDAVKHHYEAWGMQEDMFRVTVDDEMRHHNQFVPIAESSDGSSDWPAAAETDDAVVGIDTNIYDTLLHSNDDDEGLAPYSKSAHRFEYQTLPSSSHSESDALVQNVLVSADSGGLWYEAAEYLEFDGSEPQTPVLIDPSYPGHLTNETNPKHPIRKRAVASLHHININSSKKRKLVTGHDKRAIIQLGSLITPNNGVFSPSQKVLSTTTMGSGSESSTQELGATRSADYNADDDDDDDDAASNPDNDGQVPDVSTGKAKNQKKNQTKGVAIGKPQVPERAIARAAVKPSTKTIKQVSTAGASADSGKRSSPQKWTEEEERHFLEALHLYGRDWKRCAAHVGTRDANKFRSHAQKYFIRLFKQGLPLPPKVLESGEGYTLSGKPLDPNSSAALCYLRSKSYSADAAAARRAHDIEMDVLVQADVKKKLESVPERDDRDEEDAAVDNDYSVQSEQGQGYGQDLTEPISPKADELKSNLAFKVRERKPRPRTPKQNPKDEAKQRGLAFDEEAATVPGSPAKTVTSGLPMKQGDEVLSARVQEDKLTLGKSVTLDHMKTGQPTSKVDTSPVMRGIPAKAKSSGDPHIEICSLAGLITEIHGSLAIRSFCGILAGTVVDQSKTVVHLSIQDAIPLHLDWNLNSCELSMACNAAFHGVIDEIRNKKLRLIGWYHGNPEPAACNWAKIKVMHRQLYELLAARDKTLLVPEESFILMFRDKDVCHNIDNKQVSTSNVHSSADSKPICNWFAGRGLARIESIACSLQLYDTEHISNLLSQCFALINKLNLCGNVHPMYKESVVLSREIRDEGAAPLGVAAYSTWNTVQPPASCPSSIASGHVFDDANGNVESQVEQAEAFTRNPVLSHLHHRLNSWFPQSVPSNAASDDTLDLDVMHESMRTMNSMVVFMINYLSNL